MKAIEASLPCDILISKNAPHGKKKKTATSFPKWSDNKRIS